MIEFQNIYKSYKDKKILENINETKINEFHIPRWSEFPAIDIYLDQLVTYLDTYLNPYISSEENPVITKTMINIYVNEQVIGGAS